MWAFWPAPDYHQMGQQQQQQLGPTTVWGSEEVKGKQWKTPQRELRDKKNYYISGLSSKFQIQPHTLLLDTKFLLTR